MKRVIKNNIWGFIIGILVCGVVGVSAYTLLAKDIGYKDTNVESALNDLYDKANHYGTGETYSNYVAYGTRPATSVVTLDLLAGSYLCNVSASVAYGGSEDENHAIDNNTTISGCDSYHEENKFARIKQTTSITNGTGYKTLLYSLSFSCKVNTNKTITSSMANYTGENQWAEWQSNLNQITCTKIGYIVD